MTRALATLICVFCLSAKAENLLPQSFFDMRGPCFAPEVALNNLKEAEFDLVASAKFVSGENYETDVLLFQAGDSLIITMTHLDLLCIIVTADNLDFGV
tara:strand:+ start:600 stop:896 length:297 start_codon:yes stop_codon:yes gene_type:complete